MWGSGVGRGDLRPGWRASTGSIEARQSGSEAVNHDQDMIKWSANLCALPAGVLDLRVMLVRLLSVSRTCSRRR